MLALLASILATAMATTTPIITPPATINLETVREVRVEPQAELTPLQEEWLSKLEQCESSGSTTIKVLDVNNKYSYGRFQFQSQTFLGYGKEYGLIATSTTKAEPLIYDGELQKQIAHRILLDGGEKHWFNCYNKIGYKYPKGG